MSEYIDKASIINEILEVAKEPSIQRNPDTVNGLLGAYNIIFLTPPADVRKNVRGKWRDTGSGQECSVCKEIQYGYDNFRFFCAHCGADMRGE